MVKSGAVSLRGLKADAKVFDEFIFDVNTAYFEERGGYDFAKEFYAEAYRLAVKEAGGEEYVLSAIMHADERNKALSDEYGRDIFHYHLHVIYLPVVDKEVYYRKDLKDPELAGKYKETIKQVSHSKKWPRFKDESGKWVNEYSLLQDRYHEHMKAAGFTDFERGERGSTAEHLSVLEYKTQQEAERAAALAAVVSERQEAADALDMEIDQKEQTAAVIDKKVERQQERLDGLEKKVKVKEKTAVTFSDIEGMAKKTVFGGKIELAAADWETVSELAKGGILARAEVRDLTRQLDGAKKEISSLKAAFNRLYEETKDFREAVKSAPKRVMDFLRDIISRDHEHRETERAAKKQKKNEHDR